MIQYPIQQVSQFCTFYLDSHLFGIDVKKVQEIIICNDITKVPLALEEASGLIHLRGQIIAVIDLRKRLKMTSVKLKFPVYNIILKTEEEPVSLIVDEIGDVIYIEKDSYEPPPETISGISKELITCVYKLEEHLLLILDIQKILEV
ncbi:MAG: chemotaxis protein CheW [Leptospiraceae bacterium]|nr:chemotaxis protein CheW [Leptospiraceae bacterium]MCP5496019.1 chemotaxis protein CheW [Leptospiraceae bacterium]